MTCGRLHLWYGLDGQPIGQDEAARLLRDVDARRVARDEVPTGRSPTGWARVSTVHLVNDVGAGLAPVPVLYETCAFAHRPAAGDQDAKDLGVMEMWRWINREQAEAGHRAAVAWLLGEGPEPVSNW